MSSAKAATWASSEAKLHSSRSSFRLKSVMPIGTLLLPPAGAPLLVLVPPEQQTLVGAALEAGARSCLLLPIHPKEVASMLTHARAGNQPGRHTLGQEGAQREDPWRDAGGEA